MPIVGSSTNVHFFDASLENVNGEEYFRMKYIFFEGHQYFYDQHSVINPIALSDRESKLDLAPDWWSFFSR